MQKVKIMAHFVKQKYEKNVVPLQSNLHSTAKLGCASAIGASSIAFGLHELCIRTINKMNIKSIITAAVALLVSTACSGGAKQGKVMEAKGKALVVFFSHAGDNYAVGNIEVGNTKIVADYITELTGSTDNQDRLWNNPCC